MPKGVVFSPKKANYNTASYSWIDDKIYLGNQFNSVDEYQKFKVKQSKSLSEYSEHYKTTEMAQNRLKEAEKILSDKSVKGYERFKAEQERDNALIMLNTKRMNVSENLEDVITHEYGHFINRHASDNIASPKTFYGAKELGGKCINNDWTWNPNKLGGKVEASKISKYATDNPLEAFAEGFTAMEKGEQVPTSVEKVINRAKEKIGINTIAKYNNGGIIEEIEKTGIKGKIHYPPKPIKIEELIVDIEHILKRNHNVSLSEAKDFISNAEFSISRWNGQFENYYSLKGASFVDLKNGTIRTSFKSNEYDEIINNVMEVIKKWKMMTE